MDTASESVSTLKIKIPQYLQYNYILVQPPLYVVIIICSPPPPQTVSPHIQHILVSAISEWYYSTDPADPSKVLAVLEMAKELRVLPSILTANKFPFILELACWAAKRDFLMLDKWISDKMREYKVIHA